jgi:hypothetical protein
VEVRRLNQNKESASGAHGLEESAIPLAAVVRKVLQSMEPPTGGASWFVFYSFRRPLPRWKHLERAVTVALTHFRDCPSDQQSDLTITKGVRLKICRAAEKHSSLFVFGGSVDGDSGGFVVAEVARNLHICIEQKTRKVTRVLTTYPEWWLILVDRIGYGLEGVDRDQLRALVQISEPWDKVILVNPLDPARGFEL